MEHSYTDTLADCHYAIIIIYKVCIATLGYGETICQWPMGTFLPKREVHSSDKYYLIVQLLGKS